MNDYIKRSDFVKIFCKDCDWKDKGSKTCKVPCKEYSAIFSISTDDMLRRFMKYGIGE